MNEIKYPCILAWGKYLGSLDYYIKNQIDRATRDNAPRNAIYYNDEKSKWITSNEIQDGNSKEMIERNL